VFIIGINELINRIMYKRLNFSKSLFTKQVFVGFALIVALLFSVTAFGQRVTTIDKKGTIITTGNIVTESATEPTNPREGDVWFDTTSNISKIYETETTSWITIDPDSVTVDATAPTTPAEGDIWFDTAENLTKVWDGVSTWQPIQANSAFSLWDNDLDTGIQVEESTDDDHIRFDTRSQERMVIDSLGNVGIGTTIPREKVEINGGNVTLGTTAPLDGTLAGNSVFVFGHTNSNHTNNYGMKLQYDSQNNSFGTMLFTGNVFSNAFISFGRNLQHPGTWNDDNMGEWARFVEGKLGIGTDTPAVKLDVNGQARIRTLPVGEATDSIVTANVDGDLRKQSISDIAAAGEPWFTEGTTTGHTLNTGNMFFSGNIGVGTNTLSAGKVATFAGDVDVQGVLDPTKLIFSGDGSIGSFDPTTDNQYEIEFQEGRALRFKSDANTNIMHLANNGNIGLGASVEPQAELHFSNNIDNRKLILWQNTTLDNDHQFYGFGIGSGALRYQVPSTADHVFFSGTSSSSSQELVRIKGTGNVGIGIEPTAKLDVGGEARIRTLPVGEATDSIVTANVDGDLRKQSISDIITQGHLEKITEGSNTGYRILNSDPDNFGDIGSSAVDLSIQTEASTTRGATGLNSFAAGHNNTASGEESLAIGGSYHIASGNGSLAMGSGTTNVASGDGSIALGGANTASSDGSIALGFFNNSSALASIAVGYGAAASAEHSIAMGIGTTAEAIRSFAVGDNAYTGGAHSSAIGRLTTADGDHSMARGYSTYALSYGQTTIGFFSDYELSTDKSNRVGTDRLFVIGNGYSNTNRSNALVMLKNGNTTLNGSLHVTDQYRDSNNESGTAGQVLSSTVTGTDWIDATTSVVTKQVFSAEYAGAALYADGTDNIGFLTSDNAGSANNWMNFYHWSNTETDGVGTNDYDIILRFTLPEDFEAWGTTAIEIDYAGTTDANFTADVYLETSGTALASLVTTSGSGISTWAVANIPDTGLTTLGAGDTGVIVLHLTATDVVTEGDSAIRVGDITLHYTVNK